MTQKSIFHLAPVTNRNKERKIPSASVFLPCRFLAVQYMDTILFAKQHRDRRGILTDQRFMDGQGEPQMTATENISWICLRQGLLKIVLHSCFAVLCLHDCSQAHLDNSCLQPNALDRYV